MKKGKTLRSRVLAGILTLAMALTITPVTVFASGETEGNAGDDSSLYEQLELNESELTGNIIRTSSDKDESVKFDETAYFYDSTYTCTYTGGYNGKPCTTDGDFPADRLITVTHPADAANGIQETSVTYKLPSYEGMDCYKFTGSNNETTMHLQTLGVYDYIYVLAVAGGVGRNTDASFTITLHYTDETVQDENFTLYDWFTDKSSTNAIALYAGVARGDHPTSFAGNFGSATGAPYLLSLKIDSDATKLLSSISFKRQNSTPSAVNCAVFAVTGAVDSNAPAVPTATEATNLNDNGTLSFTANWNAVNGADSYCIDVSTYSNFCDSDGNPSFVNGYNNYAVEGGNTTSCIISGLDTDVAYYYRVRAVRNGYGQSLSSNRILATLPQWVLDAGLGYEDVSYTETDEGAGTLTVKKDLALTGTMQLPDGESVIMDLNGNTITAQDGAPAICAEKDAEVKLTIADNSGNGGGKITGGNGRNEGDSGSTAIDLSEAAAGSFVSVKDDVTITGGNGADSSGATNAGAGGAAIAVSDSVTVNIGSKVEIAGGNGGTATGTGNGGDGGTGISGSNSVEVAEGGKVAGGNGGNAAEANPGNGGAAGVASGTAGNVGIVHLHIWNCKVDDSSKNSILAYCVQANNSTGCPYYGEKNAEKLTLAASDMSYTGNPYSGAAFANEELKNLTGVTGDISYCLSDGITLTNSDNSGAAGEGKAPVNAGNYVAKTVVTKDEATYTATKEFTIEPKQVLAAVSVDNKEYDGTTAAGVNATVETGIAGQTLTITGLTGTFDNRNVGNDKAVSLDASNVQVNGGEGTNPDNYRIIYPADNKANVSAASLTLKVNNASKHIGKADPTFSYSITDGTVAEGDSLSGITYERTRGETPGTYGITATEAAGSNPNYSITITAGTLTIEDHTVATDAAVAATCTKSGLSEGSHCSICNEVIVAQEKVSELGHDWSGEWTIIREATATTDGRKETTCTRDGCGQKKYETIPAAGETEEPENPGVGNLDKGAEVEPDASIGEATLDNKKSELLEAPAIFTETEKQQIQSGTDARVWLEITGTDESSISADDKEEIIREAGKIMGDNPVITCFNADLFKQVGGGDKVKIYEPGMDIKVTIRIPDALLNPDTTVVREYKVIRLHYDVKTGESKVDVLSGSFDMETGEFSFQTDKFSTYSIVYSDSRFVTGVTFDKTEAALTKAGETIQLSATVAPADATNRKVTWTTSNPEVAVVDENGKVTAVGNGTCTITVTTEDGAKTAECKVTVNIPSNPDNASNPDIPGNPNNAGNPDNADNSSTSEAAVTKQQQEKNALSLNAKLKVSQTGSQINVAWGKVSEADGYNVYVAYCGTKFTQKSITQVKSGKVTKVTVKKVNGKKLNLKKNYKIYVEAYKLVDGKQISLGKTITAHIIGRKNYAYTNVKAIKLKKSSFTLKKGKTVTIKGRTVLVDKSKKQLTDAHAKEFRYATSNKKVATVSKTGKIKAVGKGTCTIYVYARNGYAKKVKVTVK